MKKIISKLLFIIVSFLVPVSLLAETSNLITQLKVIDNDTTFKYLYYYDGNNKTLETKYYLNNNTWVKMAQTEWIYNNNKCETQRERIFKSNEWVNVYEINYTYEDQNLISETHFKYQNGMSNQYKMLIFSYENAKLKLKRELISTNGQMLLTRITENTYNNDTLYYTTIKNDPTVQTKTKEYKLSYTYNAEGIIVSQQVQEKSYYSDWVNTEKINWYYDNFNKIKSLRSKKWNQYTNAWENTSMIDYEYDNNMLINEVYYKWATMFWEKTSKYSYVYNNNGSLLSTALMMPIYRQWRNVSTINYSDFVNEKANKMETVLSFWSNNNGGRQSANIPFKFNNEIDIKKGNQITISYEKIDNTDISTMSISNGLNIKVYPNPSDDYFYYNPQDYKVTTWVVYDMKGQIVKQQDVNIKTGIIDLSDAPKGFYFLKVTTADHVLSQKLIKK